MAYKTMDKHVGCAVRTNGRVEPVRTAHPTGWRRALLVGAALVLGGCSSLVSESFTLQADLPANFKFSGDAYYAPAAGQNCTVPGTGNSRAPDRKYFDTDYQPEAHRVEFQVPLTARAGGCALVLSSMRIELSGKWGEGKWGADWGQTHRDYASLSFRDELPAGYPNMPASGEKVLPGQCTWLFRTMGPERAIRKILQCRGLDDQGQVLKRLPGGALQRDQLAGKTVRLVIGLAQEEEPYYNGYWFRTDAGWKPCGGRWGRDMEELCLDPPQFKDFKMPDGRTCTVYPNCTE